jgi:hypothetical protein
MTIFKLYRSGSVIENGDEAAAGAFEFMVALTLLFAFALVFELLFDSGAVVQPNDTSANTDAASAAKILRVLYTIQSSPIDFRFLILDCRNTLLRFMDRI